MPSTPSRVSGNGNDGKYRLLFRLVLFLRLLDGALRLPPSDDEVVDAGSFPLLDGQAHRYRPISDRSPIAVETVRARRGRRSRLWNGSDECGCSCLCWPSRFSIRPSTTSAVLQTLARSSRVFPAG